MLNASRSFYYIFVHLWLNWFLGKFSKLNMYMVGIFPSQRSKLNISMICMFFRKGLSSLLHTEVWFGYKHIPWNWIQNVEQFMIAPNFCNSYRNGFDLGVFRNFEQFKLSKTTLVSYKWTAIERPSSNMNFVLILHISTGSHLSLLTKNYSWWILNEPSRSFPWNLLSCSFTHGIFA